MADETVRLLAQPLAAAAFAAFGDVIDKTEADAREINDGMAVRYHDLAHVDVLEAGGRPLINVFAAKPRSLPLTVTMLERHPRSSQGFVPLSRDPFLVVVAPPGDAVATTDVRAFVTRPGQGVNYRRGVWHHPLIALDRAADFLVVDRGADDANYDEVRLAPALQIVIAE